ncbi:MAG: hypothetical protein NVSMB29_08310 [Candidatus Dormibacteria bacterium]
MLNATASRSVAGSAAATAGFCRDPEEAGALGSVALGSESMSLETPEDQLRGLRQRADHDFLQPADPSAGREAGRHQADIAELGLRVACTRARYPNRPDGSDLYVVTVSRLGLDGQPQPAEARQVLAVLFGRGAGRVEERPGGPLIRSYRLPATAAD